MYNNQTLAQKFESNKKAKAVVNGQAASADLNDPDYLCAAFSNYKDISACVDFYNIGDL